MSAVLDGSDLARDLYSLLRDTDPARWRDEVEQNARVRLARVRGRAAELVRRGRGEAEALTEPVHRVAAVLDEHGPPEGLRGAALRDAWMRFRERMLPAYESLARALRSQAVDIPAVRPTNWYRSAFHLASALGVVLLFELLLNEHTAILASGGFALTCWALEIGRALSGKMNDRLMRVRFFELIIHPHERHRVNSATWYATALLGLTLFSPPFAAVAGVAALGAGDPLAAFVGRRWGRHALSHGRTVEGTLAFVIASTLAVLGVLAVWHPLAAWPILLVIALAAGVTGAIAELLSVRLDDNFTIPLASAAGAALTAALLLQ